MTVYLTLLYYYLFYNVTNKGKTVLLHFPSIRLAFCVHKTGEGSQLRSAVIGCKGTIYLFYLFYE